MKPIAIFLSLAAGRSFLLNAAGQQLGENYYEKTLDGFGNIRVHL
jgi:hypothetical protein